MSTIVLPVEHENIAVAIDRLPEREWNNLHAGFLTSGRGGVQFATYYERGFSTGRLIGGLVGLAVGSVVAFAALKRFQ